MKSMYFLLIVFAFLLLNESVFSKVLWNRVGSPKDWKIEGRADPNSIIPFNVALYQKNIPQLEQIVLETSNPESKIYGNWWTRDEILDLIAPPKETVYNVEKWLKQYELISIDSTGRDNLKVFAKVSVVEDIFNTKMYEFTHSSGMKLVRQFGEFSIPDDFNDVIEFVFGISEFYGQPIVRPSFKEVGNDVSLGYITPDFLRGLYNVPSTLSESAKGSMCVAEFQNDNAYLTTDLNLFNVEMMEAIHVDQKVGPFNDEEPDAESSLDVQYASAIALNATMWFWTETLWMYDFATDFFAKQDVPNVVSMSWGWPEPEQCQIGKCDGETSETYVNRTNTEFMKITQRGVTLLAASGDQGAPGDENPECILESLSTIFPGASPWVVAVGATMLTEGGNTVDYTKPKICSTMKCATTSKETSCSYPQALITSGGGFSDYVTRPDWQDDVVNAYLNNPKVKLPPESDFNRKNRGFPDVSALGHAYLIAFNGRMIQVDGTSASTPVFGAMISLMNGYLQNNGKSPLGFVNPLLYKIYGADPTAFNDISTGNNTCTERCCSSVGYVASEGWDPVVGLGTPNFGKLMKYIQTM